MSESRNYLEDQEAFREIAVFTRAQEVGKDTDKVMKIAENPDVKKRLGLLLFEMEAEPVEVEDAREALIQLTAIEHGVTPEVCARAFDISEMVIRWETVDGQA